MAHSDRGLDSVDQLRGVPDDGARGELDGDWGAYTGQAEDDEHPGEYDQ